MKTRKLWTVVPPWNIFLNHDAKLAILPLNREAMIANQVFNFGKNCSVKWQLQER